MNAVPIDSNSVTRIRQSWLAITHAAYAGFARLMSRPLTAIGCGYDDDADRDDSDLARIAMLERKPGRLGPAQAYRTIDAGSRVRRRRL